MRTPWSLLNFRRMNNLLGLWDTGSFWLHKEGRDSYWGWPYCLWCWPQVWLRGKCQIPALCIIDQVFSQLGFNVCGRKLSCPVLVSMERSKRKEMMVNGMIAVCCGGKSRYHWKHLLDLKMMGFTHKPWTAGFWGGFVEGWQCGANSDGCGSHNRMDFKLHF